MLAEPHDGAPHHLHVMPLVNVFLQGQHQTVEVVLVALLDGAVLGAKQLCHAAHDGIDVFALSDAHPCPEAEFRVLDTLCF